MTEPFILPDGEPGRREVLRRLAEGDAVALATETFYGLCADPRLTAAMQRVSSLKGDRGSNPYPLLAGRESQVAAVAPGWREVPLAAALAACFWPGPLTLILDGGAGLAKEARGVDGSVGVRWAGDSPAARIAERCPGALVATSANPSGGAPARTAGEVAAAFRGRSLLILDSGPAPGGAPSTIVDPRSSRPILLREGAIRAGEIDLACSGGRR